MCLSPDGKRLACGTREGHTVVMWDLSATCEAMRGDCADAAYKAVCDLAAWPVRSVPFLAAKLRPATADNPIARLISELGHEEFAVRERATAHLRERGFDVRAELVKARETADDLETRLRLSRLLRQPVRAPDAETLRAIRAIEVLELAVDPEAITVSPAMIHGGQTSSPMSPAPVYAFTSSSTPVSICASAARITPRNS